MERNYDEVIADMLIQLDGMERRMGKADSRMEAFDKRRSINKSKEEEFIELWSRTRGVKRQD